MKTTKIEIRCDFCKKDLVTPDGFDSPSFIHLEYTYKPSIAFQIDFKSEEKDFCDKKCLKEWINNENI